MRSETLAQIRRKASLAWMPPARLSLSQWIESEIRLPSSVSSLPGPVRLYPFQREIADAMCDPKVERVTVVKSARIGYTTLLVGVSDEKLPGAMGVIEKVCKSRKQIATSPSPVAGSSGMYVPYPVEVVVGGATVFVMDVEQFKKV